MIAIHVIVAIFIKYRREQYRIDFTFSVLQDYIITRRPVTMEGVAARQLLEYAQSTEYA